jgi:serine/threonine protein kinase
MNLRKRKTPPKNNINKQKKKKYLYICSYCQYKTNRIYNFERHSYIKHDNLIEQKFIFSNSILQYKFLHNKKKNSLTNDYSRTINDESTALLSQINQTQKNNNYNLDFILLQNIFDKNNRLSKYEEDFGSYYINRGKIIGEGAYTKTYLGEDKFLKNYVAILEINSDYKEKIQIEEYILGKVHGKGNFPQLYEVLQDESNIYLIENLMGFTLKSLFKVCDLNFDFFTIMKIGIDLISNIKILHDLGFVHRDLKPGNIVYGNLSFENFNMKNQIGIIDFGNSNLILDSKGNIKYSDKITKCAGNRCFSSNNALKGYDATKMDDIISIIYILIYFNNGNLPWKGIKKDKTNFNKNEIIEIRENISIKDLCSNFPEEFIFLVENIMNSNPREEPKYSDIINTFESLILKEKEKYSEKNNKLTWISLFEKIKNKSEEISNIKKKEINLLFDRFSLKLEDYLIYIAYNKQ